MLGIKERTFAAMQNFSVNTILSNMKIDKLNEMQLAAMDAGQKDNDMVLLSATGSGKTIAFLMPIVAQLDKHNKNTQAIIVVPSRELAQQIELVFKSMGTGFKTTCCYGGHKREIEENNLIEPPAVLIGTPGRLCDHIRRESITTDTITTIVLDEFDKSLELGFLEEVSFIIESLPNINKRILTSATEAVEIPDFLQLENPVRLNYITEKLTESLGLEIKTLHSADKDKLEALLELICQIGNRSAIIFCNHRESVERTSNWLTEQGVLNEFYHGAMEQKDRDSALFKFRSGAVDFLVTTDIAARGLDIPNIRYIIHYHLPHTEDIFTHRNGRTARMDASGTAILILSEEEKLPSYLDADTVTEMEIQEGNHLPEKPKWTALFIAAGKKDKVNKIDIVGFLSQQAELKKEDIGLIEVKDFFSFVSIKKIKASHALHLIKDKKIKNKKVKIAIAK